MLGCGFTVCVGGVLMLTLDDNSWVAIRQACIWICRRALHRQVGHGLPQFWQRQTQTGLVVHGASIAQALVLSLAQFRTGTENCALRAVDRRCTRAVQRCGP